eukprot:724612-Amphidinium_carterae.1
MMRQILPPKNNKHKIEQSVIPGISVYRVCFVLIHVLSFPEACAQLGASNFLPSGAILFLSMNFRESVRRLGAC